MRMHINIFQKFSQAALFHMFCLLALPLTRKGSCKTGRKQAGSGVSDFSANTQKCRKYLAFTVNACSFLMGRKFPISSYPTWLHSTVRTPPWYEMHHPLNSPLQHAKV